MAKKNLAFLILIIGLSIPFVTLSLENQPFNLKEYIKFFYTKHSHFLDVTYHQTLKTWHFNTPYYFPKKSWQKTNIHPRYHISAASFYKFRVSQSPYAQKIVRQAVFDATLNNKALIFDQSFNNAIANFLIIRLIEQKDLFNQIKKKQILAWIKHRLLPGLLAQDTENRAALAAVYWQYVANYLYAKKMLKFNEFQKIKQLTQNKIDLSIKQTLDKNYYYRENSLFSLHYHIVETYMLLNYGVMTNNKYYIDLANKMTKIINTLANDDGFLDASLGHRPTGCGAQSYLMAGVLNKYFDNKIQAEKFLNYADGNRFFADPKYPNRLVWYNTSLANPNQFNDDISFVNMAELALMLFDYQK